MNGGVKSASEWRAIQNETANSYVIDKICIPGVRQ